MGNSTFPQSNCNNSQCSDNIHKGKEKRMVEQDEQKKNKSFAGKRMKY